MAYINLVLIYVIPLCVEVQLKYFGLFWRLGKEKNVFSNVLKVLATFIMEDQ